MPFPFTSKRPLSERHCLPLIRTRKFDFPRKRLLFGSPSWTLPAAHLCGLSADDGLFPRSLAMAQMASASTPDTFERLLAEARAGSKEALNNLLGHLRRILLRRAN